MSYGQIRGSNTCFCFNTKPTLSTRGSPGNVYLCVCFNTHLPKTGFLIENRCGSFRPKAAIKDGFVTEDREMSFYELLGISESGTSLEIKQAYKQLARKYHPDVSPPDRMEEYTRRFIQVQEAYETLSDPRMRALYDRDLARGLHLAFKARKRHQQDEGFEERGEWKKRWHAQLSELKRRSMSKGENMSWGAQMRRRRNESSAE